ncbi:Phosphotransferase RcsD [Fundidesulfovibrio magnetotacticus]|uniref:Phosphotransferase RcsD n=1 Tax=Fundidesulfovibrio magnetotacticus TaxID=2730080 RepID=A0A6V8LZ19_9BACT|nr:Hpt domain-containing protein [Fundidesulfovibrio magnetotacticus]GFK94897.1 Phosphotransferase RcsD [Fundidesulfovibrio magnetotacticus]
MVANLVDMAKLVERMEGDQDLINEVFDMFVEEAPARRVKFQAALAGQDAQAVVMLAHSLKGASGTLHCEPLRQACFELEHAARAADQEQVSALTPPVLDLLEKTAAWMAAYRKQGA